MEDLFFNCNKNDARYTWQKIYAYKFGKKCCFVLFTTILL